MMKPFAVLFFISFSFANERNYLNDSSGSYYDIDENNDTAKLYAGNGIALLKCVFDVGDSCKVLEEYYPWGSVKVKWPLDISRKLNGDRVEFWEDGTLYSKTSYKNGIQNGLEIMYWHGSISYSKEYKDGTSIGIKQCYKNGKKSIIVSESVDCP